MTVPRGIRRALVAMLLGLALGLLAHGQPAHCIENCYPCMFRGQWCGNECRCLCKSSDALTCRCFAIWYKNPPGWE